MIKVELLKCTYSMETQNKNDADGGGWLRFYSAGSLPSITANDISLVNFLLITKLLIKLALGLLMEILPQTLV